MADTHFFCQIFFDNFCTNPAQRHNISCRGCYNKLEGSAKTQFHIWLERNRASYEAHYNGGPGENQRPDVFYKAVEEREARISDVGPVITAEQLQQEHMAGFQEGFSRGFAQGIAAGKEGGGYGPVEYQLTEKGEGLAMQKGKGPY